MLVASSKRCAVGCSNKDAIAQSLAIATSKTGLDRGKLWNLKVSALKATAGLEISQPAKNFLSLAGTAGVKDFFGRLLAGRRPVRGVCFFDEIETWICLLSI